ncbi:MAG: SRPBCC family protein [Gaiellales bacterium]
MNRTIVERTSDREVVVTRTFDAPAPLVFEAWTTPDLFKQWWVPRSMGMTLRSCDLDVRTGGTYRLVFGDDPANTTPFFGRYIDVVPNQRIVWTNEEDGTDGPVTTVTFDEKDGKTTIVVSELYPTKEALDAAGTGAQDVMNETFDQLDKLLASLAAQP